MQPHHSNSNVRWLMQLGGNKDQRGDVKEYLLFFVLVGNEGGHGAFCHWYVMLQNVVCYLMQHNLLLAN